MKTYTLDTKGTCKDCKTKMTQKTKNTPACLGKIYVSEENKNIIIEFQKVTKITPKYVKFKAQIYSPHNKMLENAEVNCKKEGLPLRKPTKQEKKEYENAKLLDMLRTKL